MSSRHPGALALQVRLPRVIGWTCLTVALCTFVSDRHRSFFGRWSGAAFAAILLAGAVWCLLAWRSWRAYETARVLPAARLGPAALLDAATLVWGSGYLWAALDAPANASQVFGLNFFGSSSPGAIVLYWLALAFLTAAVSWRLLRAVTPGWANISLSLVTLLVLVLLGEGGVRAKALVAPTTQGFPTYTSDLWMRRYVTLNRLGFRDTEHPLAPIPYTRRILLIGDSFTFGVGIADPSDRLGEQLAGDLDRVTGTNWEVINASQPDRNTLEEIAILDSTLVYHPDVVILVYVFNDIEYLRPMTQRTVLTEAPETAWQRVHPMRVVFRNSFLFQECYVRMRALRWSVRPDDRRDDPYADRALVQRHLVDLSRFVAEARRAGATVGIVPFDATVVSSSASRLRYESFAGPALAAGLPIWRVDSVFRGLSIRDLTVNSLDGHPNGLANRVVAARVQERVTAALGE